MAREKIYTRAGDDGTTGLFYGGRVGKDSALPRAYGAVDEAQAILGLVRAEAGKGTELDDMLVHICRDLWVLMAELATLPENRTKLVDGKSRVTAEMVEKLEHMIDSLDERLPRRRTLSCPDRTRSLHSSTSVAPLRAVQNGIRSPPRHHRRRRVHISIVCQTCCGRSRAGKKACRCPSKT